MKNKKISLEQMLSMVLGRKGNLVSMSKSCGPEMAIYNSNLVVNDEVVWYGDVDVKEVKKYLCNIANLYEVDIEIYSENPIRIFNFNNRSQKEIKKEQKELIKKAKPIWTTKNPDKWNEEDWLDAYEKNVEHRQTMRKQRSIAYGFLTPTGNEWNWLSRLYYNNFIYKAYKKIKQAYYTYIDFPIKLTKWSLYDLEFKDGKSIKIDKNYSKWEIIKIFFSKVKKEYYLVKEYKRKNNG